jgi:hypothetical protein
MLLFCFVIAWAARGLVKQGTYDARTGWSNAWRKARRRTGRSFHKARRHPSRAVRWPARTAYGAARTGAGLFYAGRASVRGGRTVWRSLWTGAKDGAEIGRVKHAIYAAKREKRRAERRAAWDGEPYPRTQTPRTDDARTDDLPPWQRLTIHWPDGRTTVDAIRGADQDEALANARSNWPDAVGFEYEGLDDDFPTPTDAELGITDFRRPTPSGTSETASQETEAEAQAPGDGAESDRDQLATVTPIREEESMSAPAGEAVGLAPAIEIYERWIKELEDGPAGLEQLSAGLAGHGLSGDPVDCPSQASEHLSAAKAAMEQGLAALQQHQSAADTLRSLNGEEAESTSFYTAG